MTAADAAALLAEATLHRGPWRDEPGYNNAGMPTRFFFIPGHNAAKRVEMLAGDSLLCVAAPGLGFMAPPDRDPAVEAKVAKFLKATELE